MADSVTLREEDVGRIGEYVKPWLREVVDRAVHTAAAPLVAQGSVDNRLLERAVRVEEELKAQRELMDERFEFTKERFAAIDARFDDLIAYSDRRFEALENRIDQSIAHSDKRFDDAIAQSNRRADDTIAQCNRRFDDSIAQSNRRADDIIAQSNQRFDDAMVQSDRRFKTLVWVVGAGFAAVTLLTTIFSLLG